MAKITVGLPIFNAGKYLNDAIQSVINQTYTNWLLIIIDDGSTDDSLSIARGFTDDRIKIICDGSNLGLAARLNQIASMCNSEFLARMDADDIMHPERLERQIKYLTLYPNTDVVGSSAIIIDTQNDPVNHRSATAASNALDAARSGSFIHPTILARASWFKNNPYSEDILRAEDYDLWLRTADYSIFRNISEPLLYYREIGISHKNKYLKSSKGIRKSLARTRLIPLRAKIPLILSIYIKDLIYLVAGLIDKEELLIKRRGARLQNAEVLAHKQIISKSIAK